MASNESLPQVKRTKKGLTILLLVAGLLVAGCAVLLVILFLWLWPALRLAPGTRQVNTDGFACAVAMAINLADDSQLGGSQPEILCEDLKDLFRTTFQEKNYARIEDWLMTETNLLLAARSIPLELTQIEYGEHISRTQANLAQGIPTLVIVVLPDFTHCIVIIGYGAQEGFFYLDSLQDPRDGQLPAELDFQQDYGVALQDAWLYTFALARK